MWLPITVVVLLSLFNGLSAAECKFDVKMEQYLLNEGFHRNITYKVSFDDDHNYYLYEDCFVGMVQTLPAGVYANPDELRDFKRFAKLVAIPMSKVNIELPMEESDPMRVFLIGKIFDGKTKLWLPIHARYHDAVAGGGYARNEIGSPNLYMRCPDHRLDHCDEDPNQISFLCNSGNSKEICIWRSVPFTMYTNSLILEIPVGNTHDYHLVAAVTVSAVAAGSLYLLKTLHEYKLLSNKKFR